MSKLKYHVKNKEVLDSFLLNIPLVKPGKMFGYPVYYVRGKLFASVYENAICIKVPKLLSKELHNREEIVHFPPMDIPIMRELNQIK